MGGVVYRYRDPFIELLFEDISRLILGEAIDSEFILARQCELAAANSTTMAEYWRMTERRRAIPDSAFKESPLYLFPDQEPVREFRTSGTSGTGSGCVAYSPRGMELMRISIVENARRHIVQNLDRPAIIRLVPSPKSAPNMVMAYGMELIATRFGDPELSDVVVHESGIDYDRLISAISRASAAGVPTVLIGASFAIVNACEGLAHRGRRFVLPRGSKAVDAGGFKGRSKTLTVSDLRCALKDTFGIEAYGCVNLFGMTELASQLYDQLDVPVGPLGERPKGSLPFVQLRVRDPNTMEEVAHGHGLLEVTDLCLIDRPPTLLTGDLAIAVDAGAAIVGRTERRSSRGCSLALDALTAPETVDA